MPRPTHLILLSMISLIGCQSHRPVGDAASAEMFAPTAMRIHPIFTQIEEASVDGKPNGIEAQLEFQDQFGDPTKANGSVMFELFEYRKDSPDPRGHRLAGPWVMSIASASEQRDRWNTTLRTYRFQLDYPTASKSTSYVLSAAFEAGGGGRFFDRIVLPAKIKVVAKPRLKL